MENCDLYDIWSKACNYYDIPEDTIRSWYERIRTKLNEDITKRVYHNWSCMLVPKRVGLEDAKPHIVLAAFFQYYEFDLERSCVQDNCKIFKEFCQDSMIEDENMKQLVCRLLGEKSTEGVNGDIDYDMAFLQDLDLLILASTPGVYKKYAELSRKEWSTSGKTNFDILRRKTLTDQRPSTSRKCKEIISRSPWKSASGKVNRFKKIVDEQAKKKIRRSVYIVKDNQVLRKMTPKRICSPQRKFSKRLLNKSKRNAKKTKKSSTLEEGEIVSDPNNSLESNKADSTSKCEADEDDCFVVEPTLEEITIDDNDDDNIPSTSDITINYQSLLCSFKERTSSTPYHNKISATSNEAIVDTEINVNKKPEDNDVLPYFVDVGPSYGIESINSTENFSDYIKFSTLKEKSSTTVGTVRLKRNSDEGKVIDLDDTSNDGTDTTLKYKSCDGDDDSVIFISETNKNDFIPIVGDNKPKSSHKPLTLSQPTAQTPAKRLRTNNFFTQSETKKLNEYNDNAYNPSTTRGLTSGKRMVIIDGSNVAFKHGLDQEFSVKGLKIAIEYFEKMGHEVKAVIPQFRMNKSKSTNPEELERLHKAGKIVQTPCKNLPGYVSTSYDDRFILQLAFTLDAAIVSNDNYRDLLHENPAFRKIVENRVIGYTWCNDIFILPKDPYGKWGPTLHTILNRF